MADDVSENHCTSSVDNEVMTSDHPKTRWGLDEISAIFKCIFLNENVWIVIKILLKFTPHGRISNTPSLLQVMARRWTGAKLSESMMD